MFPLPLVASIDGSRQLRSLLAFVHLCGAVAIFLTSLPLPLQWTGLLLLTISMALYWRQNQQIRVRGNQNGKFEVWLSGKWCVASIDSSSVIWPGLTVVRFATESERLHRHLVILPDSLPKEDFRRLRVWLRWRSRKPESGRTMSPDQ
jgi:toxin CptA